MLISLLKSPLFRNGEGSAKAIQNPYPGSDQYTTSLKVNEFFRLVGTVTTPSFNEIG